ncbi:4Fe-4S dicluster domain-containing protein [Paraneptunicella aestuarii]|uniref:4Fe-4S dicluster domain-containing protein n=1 Tax=Paraneptunicella aestuarii TaxID=2831148 RepID=UPI001E517831|nr:4Fe-4S dicluster domain-containing protein [Paraneptunicella aestuarii]UAA40588.1 4Fe-4S dicluster domain-containing protein [Paraneptunicella aestuarii]
MRKQYLPKDSLPALYEALRKRGYKIIAPHVHDGAIVFSEQHSPDTLPWGWQEETEPGRYQLQHTERDNKSENPARAFAWNNGPQGIKPWLFKPKQEMWRAEETENGLRFRQPDYAAEPIAFIGARACDLAALNLQDKHFIQGHYPDPFYSAQRQQLLLVAVNCQRSASTCFCTSTGDGPEALFGYDLLLDELDEGFLIEAKSEVGDEILVELALELPLELPLDACEQSLLEQAEQQLQQAAQQQRKMPSDSELRLLQNKLDDQRWHEIAEKCLACGNCTLVCPTCFCSKQESNSEKLGEVSLASVQTFHPEQSDNNDVASQVRVWDSCFSEQHSHIAGKNIRPEISQRYRQWLLHKLLMWQEQFGRSGCVGCGRCISWCPVGIDLVEEANLLLRSELDQAVEQATGERP